MSNTNFAELAINAVGAERDRQVNDLGFDDHHDNAHTKGELASAASCYSALAGNPRAQSTAWPFGQENFKPSNDKLIDLAKAGALILAEIERVCRNGVAIVLVPHERDDNGFWTHPAWPLTDDEEGIPNLWFEERGLQLKVVEFEYDAEEEIQEKYYETGAPDCSAWTPTIPEGEGWFVFSVHDTESGPVCVFVRPQRFEDSEQEIADRRAAQ